MKRMLVSVIAVLIPIGVGTTLLVHGGSAAAATPKFDNSTDTVHCGSFSGKATITPALQSGGSSPTTIKVSGALHGCSDATGKVSGSTTSDTDFYGTVSGTLSGTSNNLGTLLGCSSAAGTLTVK